MVVRFHQRALLFSLYVYYTKRMDRIFNGRINEAYTQGRISALEKLAVSSHWIRSMLQKAKPSMPAAEAFEQRMFDAAGRVGAKQSAIPKYSGPYNISTDVPRNNLLLDLKSKLEDAGNFANEKWINPGWDLDK